MSMPKAVRISLANKCQLLFGGAIILIVVAALAVVWVRMEKLVTEGQESHARRTAELWLQDKLQLVGAFPPGDDPEMTLQFDKDMTLALIEKDSFESLSDRDPPPHDVFLANAVHKFQIQPDLDEHFIESRDDQNQPYYRYARAIRDSDLKSSESPIAPEAIAGADPLEMVLLIQFRDNRVQRQQIRNQIYIISAGLVGMLLAIGAFWFITTRIILSPVRVLRDTAEKIAEGDTNIRSDINTGDEFEQLSGMFNTMVATLNAKEKELRQSNKSLDLKLGELAEHNVALFEANKIKDEFLANVSHELRTPLHGIIGFAEVLEETLRSRTGPVDEKRKRYIANIIISSRRLLDLINDLLDLSKIDAGRMEVTVEPMSVVDTCEGLINLIRPQAEKAGIELRLKMAKDIPVVRTDAGKVQQIVFNFLSNAVKFSPRDGSVTLSATVRESPNSQHLCIGVADTGPGIAPDLHEKIFDKFTQLDATVTKEHGGTGLGLTISRDLAKILQGQIEVQSEVGQGASFCLLIPFEMESRSVPLMPDLATDATASMIGN